MCHVQCVMCHGNALQREPFLRSSLHITHNTLHKSIRYRSESGQIAIGFVIVMVAGLVFVMAILNLGQMAQVRVETSNAADAGALAGASWIASGENEAALISGRMLDLLAMVQAIYIVPFCPGAEARDYANQLWASLYATPALD